MRLFDMEGLIQPMQTLVLHKKTKMGIQLFGNAIAQMVFDLD
jgi:hypothetical protein